jgi:multisubunit Na+/H+ antiporter MnhB subunit
MALKTFVENVFWWAHAAVLGAVVLSVGGLAYCAYRWSQSNHYDRGVWGRRFWVALVVTLVAVVLLAIVPSTPPLINMVR